MTAVGVSITDWIDDEPQPGIVRAVLMDAHGRAWTFVDKVAVFTADAVSATSALPQPGVIRCVVVRQDGELTTIDTSVPVHVTSEEGTEVFVVPTRKIGRAHV